MRRALLIVVGCLALLIAGCGEDSSTTSETSSPPPAAEEPSGAGEATDEAADKTKPKVTVPQGAPPKELVVEDLEEGTGPAAKAGDEVTVHYVGVGQKTGKEFDASWNAGQPFTFPLGAGAVIPGWDQGIEGMKVGGRRELIIPPNLAYGPEGFPPAIGPNETLVFVVDLLGIQ